MKAVSVVMAVYNGKRFLPPLVESVLGQLLAGDELIAIDDASTDGSADWLEKLDDDRVRVVRNDRNRGVLATFERGLAMARHDIVFLCDQDDIWLPGRRCAMVTAFEREPEVLIVISDAAIVDASGVVRAPSFMATRGGFRGSWWSTLVRNRYLGCAMALRRTLLAAALPIPRIVPMHDMWIGLLGTVLGRVHYIGMPLLHYRRHDANVSPSHRQSLGRMMRWRLALLAALVVRLVALKLGPGAR